MSQHLSERHSPLRDCWSRLRTRTPKSVVSALIKQSQRLPSETLPVADLGQRQRTRRSSAPDISHRGRRPTSVILDVPGSAGSKRKTPTDCLRQYLPPWHQSVPCIARPSSAQSQGSSMKDHARPCNLKTPAERFNACVAANRLRPPPKADIA